jgi:hypothetical protein
MRWPGALLDKRSAYRGNLSPARPSMVFLPRRGPTLALRCARLIDTRKCSGSAWFVPEQRAIVSGFLEPRAKQAQPDVGNDAKLRQTLAVYNASSHLGSRRGEVAPSWSEWKGLRGSATNGGRLRR